MEEGIENDPSVNLFLPRLAMELGGPYHANNRSGKGR